MKVTCQSCQKSYDIPDDRLPQGKKVKFPCPACKSPVEIDLRDPGSGSDPSGNGGEAAETQLATGEALKKEIFKSVENLPPMPQVVHKAREVMANPNSSFKELAIIFVTDQAIATRVLKLANSAYYGLSKKVASIQQASVLLGHKTLAELITMVSTSGLLNRELKGYGLQPGQLWEHSLAVAFGSRFIAQSKYPDFSDDAFAAGLIHDAGQIALDKYIVERQETFDRLMGDEQMSLLSAERQVLGFDHAEVTYEVCNKWNVPEDLAIAIRHHHRPSESNENTLAYLLHTADCIAMMSGMGGGMDALSCEIEEGAVDFLGLSNKDISGILDKVVTSVQNTLQEFK